MMRGPSGVRNQLRSLRLWDLRENAKVASESTGTCNMWSSSNGMLKAPASGSFRFMHTTHARMPVVAKQQTRDKNAESCDRTCKAANSLDDLGTRSSLATGQGQ